MYCSKCGKENKDGTNFCAACGRSLRTDIIDKPEQPSVNNKEEHRTDSSKGLFKAAVEETEVTLGNKETNVYTELSEGSDVKETEGPSTESAKDIVKDIVKEGTMQYWIVRLKYIYLGAVLSAVWAFAVGETFAGIALLLCAAFLSPVMERKFLKGKKKVCWAAAGLCLLVAVILWNNAGEEEAIIDMVKNTKGLGSISIDYDGITLSDAFEEFFDSEAWEYGETEDGEKFVEFTGTYKSAVSTDVHFLCQFICEPRQNDEYTITMGYASVDNDALDDNGKVAMMATIYENYLNSYDKLE